MVPCGTSLFFSFSLSIKGLVATKSFFSFELKGGAFGGHYIVFFSFSMGMAPGNHQVFFLFLESKGTQMVTKVFFFFIID
jgi:hypothetical protein